MTDLSGSGQKIVSLQISILVSMVLGGYVLRSSSWLRHDLQAVSATGRPPIRHYFVKQTSSTANEELLIFNITTPRENSSIPRFSTTSAPSARTNATSRSESSLQPHSTSVSSLATTARIPVSASKSVTKLDEWPSVREIDAEHQQLFAATQDDITLVYTARDKASFFHPDQNCTSGLKHKCCSVSYLLPWEKSEHALLTVSLPRELADVYYGHKGCMNGKAEGPGLSGRHPTLLTLQVAPCLRAGTIIYVCGGGDVTSFLQDIHALITVPFVLVVGDTDYEIPDALHDAMVAPGTNILHVFGQNANDKVTELDAFTVLPIGLSRWSPQSVILDTVLRARGYKNPFAVHRRAATRRYDETQRPLVLMSYMTMKNRGDRAHAQRTAAHAMACEGNGDSLSLCPMKIPMKILYEMIDSVALGISPEGHGHDCYRTWEYLYLGVIPVVQKAKWYGNMYADLPVLVLDTFNISHAQFKIRALEFLTSRAFTSSNFDRGWEQLFMGYWRRRVLVAAGRNTTTYMRDPGPTGAYFEMYDYTVDLV